MSSALTLSSNEYRRVDTKGLSDWEDVVREEEGHRASMRGPLLLGMLTLVFGVGGFFLWASETTIAAASIAQGRVIVQSNTKTVSHLDGGTLKELLVHEGEVVKEGQILALLDVTRSQSTLVQIRQERFAASVRLARLNAEKDGLPTFTFPVALPEGMDATAANQVVGTEQRLFGERTNLYRDQIAADQSSIEQLRSQRDALVARRKSSEVQADVMRRDLDALTGLSEKQLARRSDLNDKKIQLIDMQARIAEADAALAENRQREAQLELSVSNRRTDYFRALSEDIQASQADIARTTQQIIAAEDVVAKSAIRSPQDGTVANIRIRTPGSAVIPGQPIVDIVPANQPMIIEGQANAQDIDTIHVGESAEIRLSSFGAEEAAPLIGKIIYIAPDSIVDERTGAVTFTFRADIDMAELKKQPNLFLYPGMAAEVYIVSGDRTALAYLTEPVLKSFSRAFRED